MNKKKVFNFFSVNKIKKKTDIFQKLINFNYAKLTNIFIFLYQKFNFKLKIKSKVENSNKKENLNISPFN